MDAAMAQAQAAVRLADVDPAHAAPVAASALRRARQERDPEATALAERAWGHALLLTGEPAAAIRHLRRSIAAGRVAGIPALIGEARSKLAYALVMRGRPRAALAEIELATGELTGVAAARARAQRAVVLTEIGLLDEALTDYQAALPELRAAGDTLGVARMLVNRGVLHARRHAFGAAVTDLSEAEALSERLGRNLAVGIIAENLGYVEALRGDVPTALGHLDRAEMIIATSGGHVAPVLHDRGVLLLSVGLTDEARRAAERALTAFQRERRQLKVPEVRLLLAQIASVVGDPGEAVTQARWAVREFTRQRRPEWAAQARLAACQASLANGGRVRGAQIDAIVSTLSTRASPAAVLEARLVAATVSVRSGRVADAASHLAVASRYARRPGPAAVRARGWYAEALRRLRTDATGSAMVAIRRGLRILDQHATSLGAADLRVRSAAQRGQLADLGLGLAMRHGRPARVFEWAERGRASRLLHRAARPAEDGHLAELLSQLRQTAADLSDAQKRADPRLVRRQILLERQIRDHTRRQRRPTDDQPTAPVRPAEVARHLGDRALLEYLQHEGDLYALSLVHGRLRLRAVGPVAPVADLLQRLPFALHRLARRSVRSQSRAAAVELLNHAARHLDDILLRPFVEVEDAPLVIVPTQPLHRVPWSILPSCTGRAIAVAPSATVWRGAHASLATGGIAAAAGPDLPGAHEETELVAAIHGCPPLLGAHATAEAVLAAFASSRLVHVAAHGRLSTPNPLFSSLLLADGPLFVYDLERLGRAPHTVVVAACDAGRSAVYAGDELLGLSSTLIARGTANLVASVIPIPDAETTALMDAFHRGLASGEAPSAALASAQAQLRDDDPVRQAAAAGFVCVGSGFNPPFGSGVRATGPRG
jgi:tetratricopeptide (TPR) repeat protein